MLRFRPLVQGAEPQALADFFVVAQTIDDVLRPGNFLVGPDFALTWSAARSETIAWEIFHGRLLDSAQTRSQQTFLSWHVLAQENPVLSVKLDVPARRLHVTRGLLCHVWEGFDAGGGVIDSRETTRWTNELVGTIALERYTDLDELRDELICLLWQAVTGTSRLPLTSVEAPLPAFVLGQLHYVYRRDSGETPIESWETGLVESWRAPLCWRERVKLIEFILRRMTAADLPRLSGVFLAEWLACGLPLPRLLRSLFNDVSLSPYTGFVETTLAWIDHLTQGKALTPAEQVDFLSHLLRQLGRHLTAYDLVTFHHRGANYPDALLLDRVLKAYLQALERQPEFFAGSDPKARLRRRALRQGCLLRRHYEGHLVPNAPTSPGENARVMPSSFPRVPEEQLTQSHRRKRQLFSDDPLPGLLSANGREAFRQSLGDLNDIAERTELGVGLFIDRPLGYAKAPVEPDQTPLLAHEAFSRSLACRRWQELQRLSLALEIPAAEAQAMSSETSTWPTGLPQVALESCPRPVAALADVRRVADDFVILRTLPVSLRVWRNLFDWRPLLDRYRLLFLADGACMWCVRLRNEENRPVLALADGDGRRRLDMYVDTAQGFAARAGVEFPVAGLLVVTVHEDTLESPLLTRHDLWAAPFRVRPQNPATPLDEP